MQRKTLLAALLAAPLLTLGLGACSPEVIGSTAWCEMMDAKSKADWSANEAADYAKHCVLDGD